MTESMPSFVLSSTMRHLIYCAVIVMGLSLAGCGPAEAPSTDSPASSVEPAMVFPVEEYASRRTSKTFGEYIQDKFRGYHVADDVEFTDMTEEVPVVAITEGTVEEVEWVSGYGGFIRVKHPTVNALYAHIDLESAGVEEGDTVQAGQFLANLGDHESSETDGERKHLHFGLYRGSERRINGYEASAEAVSTWLNPQDFFTQNGLNTMPPKKRYNPAQDPHDLGGDLFKLEFDVPTEWEIEYIPALEAINLFTLSGDGTARERSQMLIRYFDADKFLTLNTVTVHSTEELTIGQGNYIARRYDIEKKPNVADFKDQPAWRNQRHTVTDFSGAGEGRKRYYVVAARPDLNPTLYEKILESISIQF